MNRKFPIFRGAQTPPPQSNFQEIPTQSRYPPSVNSSSQASTPSNSFGGSARQRTYNHPQSPSSHGQPSPTEAAGIIAQLKNKSVDELRKLLTDKEAYDTFFNSLDQVKIQNNLRDELRKETLQLAKENLEKEPQISELRNQCTVIRTSELAAAQEKLTELERIKEETLRRCSPSGLLEKLHERMNEVDEESEVLHRQLLEKEIDLPTFIQKYKKLRTLYHRQALLHLAAKTSSLTS
ncbi:vacuolar protein-sorting-associated protein 37 homolog 1-like [Curcuma longa]|uniref:vacuolar protein-sorting-associated protein 37 homolog 1-like n=1 Tax=Curcuma longa TaxID=136217 RepID=UPI003D9E1AE1